MKLASRAGRRESRDLSKLGGSPSRVREGRKIVQLISKNGNLSSHFGFYELRALREAAGATPRIPQPPPDFHHSLILHARTDSTTADRNAMQGLIQTALELAVLSGYDGAGR